ncbi:MAG: hypothetical protein AAGA58_05735 [Verrucomicrobiota bacterium]
MKFTRCLAIMIAATAPQVVLSQGELNPTNAPSAGMRTLHQLEPRTPLSQQTGAASITISQSGSYYLTEDLIFMNNGIVISADNVTVDLNGFTIELENFANTGTAIDIQTGVNNVTVRNGHISKGSFLGFSFVNGIRADSDATSIRVTNVSVLSCANNGIDLPKDGATFVRNCEVSTCLGTGITAELVGSCTVANVLGRAIDATIVRDCKTSGFGGIRTVLAAHCESEVTGGATAHESELAYECRGVATNGSGIVTKLASNCVAESTGSNPALTAELVYASSGSAANSIGIDAEYGVHESRGTCNGSSGIGIKGQNVTHCTASNGPAGGTGIDADKAVGFSRGDGGITAEIAVGCTQPSGSSLTVTQSFLNFVAP